MKNIPIGSEATLKSGSDVLGQGHLRGCGSIPPKNMPDWNYAIDEAQTMKELIEISNDLVELD